MIFQTLDDVFLNLSSFHSFYVREHPVSGFQVVANSGDDETQIALLDYREDAIIFLGAVMKAMTDGQSRDNAKRIFDYLEDLEKQQS